LPSQAKKGGDLIRATVLRKGEQGEGVIWENRGGDGEGRKGRVGGSSELSTGGEKEKPPFLQTRLIRNNS